MKTNIDRSYLGHCVLLDTQTIDHFADIYVHSTPSEANTVEMSL